MNDKTRPILAMSRGHRRRINALAFTSNGGLLASGSDDKTVRVWDTETGEEVAMHRQYQFKWSIESLTFSPDGSKLAFVTVGRSGVAKGCTCAFIWEPQEKKDATEIARKQKLRYEFSGPIFSASGDIVAFAERSILLFDASSGELLERKFDEGLCSVVAFSPDGTLVASGCRGGGINLWDAVTGKRLRTLAGHTQWVGCLGFSPDSRTLVSASDDRTIRVWDAITGEEECVIDGSGKEVVYLEFLPDNDRFVTSHSGDSGEHVRMWQFDSDREIGLWQPRKGCLVTSVALSPDGNFLATGEHFGEVKVWRMQELFPAARLTGAGELLPR